MAMASSTEISNLPDDCVAHVISLTTPRDACRLTTVSTDFRSAAESDAVWGRFLPSDHQDIVARSDADTQQHLLDVLRSKKGVFMHLADAPILIDDGRKSFVLDKVSGKICLMIAPREMTIVWGDTPSYWEWISMPDSRFAEVAKLLRVCWLEISVRIGTSLLSPKTTYSAYLVFKLIYEGSGFEDAPVDTSVGMSYGPKDTRSIFLEPYDCEARQLQIIPRIMDFFNFSPCAPPAEETSSNSETNGRNPARRSDGWMEVELGKCFVDGGDGGEVEVSLKEVESGYWKRGLAVQGIEFRPKP